MKNLFKILPIIILFSCSDETIEIKQDENANFKTLSKKIIYYPSKSNFTKKRVQYFNSNNFLIRDTLFNNNGTWLERRDKYKNNNVIINDTYNNSNVLTNKYTEEYDNFGRLIKITGSSAYNNTFVYNNDNTISVYHYDGNNYFKFSLNSDGIIYKKLEILDGSIRTLNFLNNLPIELLDNNVLYGSITYFPNTMPLNLIKSKTEMNNTILRALRLEHLPSECNLYLKNWLGMYRYERLFDNENYQIQSKDYYIDNNQVPSIETIESETYYFY